MFYLETLTSSSVDVTLLTLGDEGPLPALYFGEGSHEFLGSTLYKEILFTNPPPISTL